MAEERRVELGQYIADLDRRLGAGTFGKVYLGKARDTGQEVAIKRIQYRMEMGATNAYMVKMAQTEIRSAMSLNGHPNVVEFLDYFDDGISFWLTMEYCPLGDLDRYLHDKCRDFDLNRKMDIMLQCVKGIAFMHSFEPPMVHRDIKPKNFLVSGVGEITVKATDFGVAKLLEKTSQDGNTCYGGSLYMNTFVGSPAFMAPEMFEMDKELHYSSAVDIFSLGLLLQVLLMFSPEKPSTYPQLKGLEMKLHTIGQTVKEAMRCGQEIPEIVQDDPTDSMVVRKLKNIIQSMTKADPKQRQQLFIVQDELQDEIDCMAHERSHSPESSEHKNTASNDNERITDDETQASLVKETGDREPANERSHFPESSEHKNTESNDNERITDEETQASLVKETGDREPANERSHSPESSEHKSTVSNDSERITDDETQASLVKETGDREPDKMEDKTKAVTDKPQDTPSGIEQEALFNTPIKHPLYDVSNFGDFNPLQEIMERMNLNNPRKPAGKPFPSEPPSIPSIKHHMKERMPLRANIPEPKIALPKVPKYPHIEHPPSLFERMSKPSKMSAKPVPSKHFEKPYSPNLFEMPQPYQKQERLKDFEKKPEPEQMPRARFMQRDEMEDRTKLVAAESGIDDEDLFSTPMKHPLYDVSNFGDFSPLQEIMERMNLNNPRKPAGKPSPSKPLSSKHHMKERMPLRAKVLEEKSTLLKMPEYPQIPRPPSLHETLPQPSRVSNNPLPSKQSEKPYSSTSVDKQETPAGAPKIPDDNDPDDYLLTPKPHDKLPAKLRQDRLDDFEKKPVPEEKPRPRSRRKSDELTDDERKDVYCVSNINNFKKLKEIMARFNHSSDEED